MTSGRRSLIRSCGVTLIELAITIALVGIVAALIVNFVAPVRSYIDTSRRAALADAADTALRRIGRDLRLALPNSVRVTTAGGIVYLEMLLVRTGGRYRSESDPAATNTCPDGAGSTPADDVLAIGVADDCFKTLGDVPNVAQINTATDHLVVFNMPPGTPNADAYEYSGTGGNKTAIQTVADGSGSERFVFPAAHAFTYESPGKRFFVIEGPVTYACSTAAGTMLRYSGYAIASTQPAPPGGTGALMVDKVSGCSFTYDSSVSSQGAGLVTLSLQLTMQDSRGASETVSLYHAVHVNNVP
jgi:MSHA biogenesis protein MshO